MQMSQRTCFRHWVNCVTLQWKMPLESSCWPHSPKKPFKRCGNQMFQSHFSLCSENLPRAAPNRLLLLYNWDMIILTYLFVLLWEEAHGWGFKNGIFHNSIWLGKKLHLWAYWGRYSLNSWKSELKQETFLFCSRLMFSKKMLKKNSYWNACAFKKNCSCLLKLKK